MYGTWLALATVILIGVCGYLFLDFKQTPSQDPVISPVEPLIVLSTTTVSVRAASENEFANWSCSWHEYLAQHLRLSFTGARCPQSVGIPKSAYYEFAVKGDAIVHGFSDNPLSFKAKDITVFRKKPAESSTSAV